MATKKELTKELIELGFNESELKDKTNKQLEKLISDAESQKPTDEPVDMMAEMQKQMALMMEQMNALKEENTQLKTETVADKVKEEPVRKITKVDKDRLIPVMNITAHSLVYQSKRSGAEWNWGEYGDIEHMEMQELITMRSGQRRFLDEPFILVMDDDAVSYLGLEKMYDKMISPDNIDKVFRMQNDDFEEVIETAPRGIQILIINRMKQLVDQNKLDSRNKIAFVNEKFNTDIGA